MRCPATSGWLRRRCRLTQRMSGKKGASHVEKLLSSVHQQNILTRGSSLMWTQGTNFGHTFNLNSHCIIAQIGRLTIRHPNPLRTVRKLDAHGVTNWYSSTSSVLVPKSAYSSRFTTLDMRCAHEQPAIEEKNLNLSVDHLSPGYTSTRSN